MVRWLPFAHSILVKNSVKRPTNTFFSEVRSREHALTRCQDWDSLLCRSLPAIIASLLGWVEVGKDVKEADTTCEYKNIRVHYRKQVSKPLQHDHQWISNICQPLPIRLHQQLKLMMLALEWYKKVYHKLPIACLYHWPSISFFLQLSSKEYNLSIYDHLFYKESSLSRSAKNNLELNKLHRGFEKLCSL